MAVETMALVLHHSKAKGTALTILLGIANHAGDGGAWPAVETLAKYGRCSERRVQQVLTDLVKAGELAVHRQAGGTRDLPDHKRPNRYDVLLACPRWCDGTANHRVRSGHVFHSEEVLQPGLPGVPGVSESDRVQPASPGAPGFTGGGEAGCTQTVPVNPATTKSVDNVTTSRARRQPPAAPDVVHKLAAEARAAMRATPVHIDLNDHTLAPASSTESETP